MRVYYDLEDVQEGVIYGGLTCNQIRAMLGVNKDTVQRGIYKKNLIKKRYRIHQSDYTDEIEKNEDAFPQKFIDQVEEMWSEIQTLFHDVEWTKCIVKHKPDTIRATSSSLRCGDLR